MELTRIASHCVWLGTHGIDLGAISVFFYCFDLRENILDLQEAAGGARMHPNYVRIGGLNGDLPRRLSREARRAHREVSRPHARAARPAASQSDLSGPHDRRRHPRARRGDRSGASPGPALRASGIAYDVRKAFPYTGYDTYDFDMPTRTEGDAYARFLVRLDEMEQSMRIIEQARRRLDTPGPVMIDDPKVALPPKETIALSMEALIHHFKLVSEGFRVPPGDVYQADRVAARRARLLRRQQRREPSVARSHASAQLVQPAGAQGHRARQSHRRPRRDDRLARSRLRRGRPMTRCACGATPRHPFAIVRCIRRDARRTHVRRGCCRDERDERENFPAAERCAECDESCALRGARRRCSRSCTCFKSTKAT